MLKKFSRAISRPLVSILMFLYRMKVIGKEKVIKEGPAILVSNHRNYFDIFFVMSLYKGEEIIFVGRSRVKRNPIGRFLAWAFDVILVDRDGTDIVPLKNMIQTIKENKILGIFPEGTRKGLHKGEFKSGAAYIAMKTKVDVLPVAVNGPLKPFRKGNYLKVGDKFNLSTMIRKDKTTKDKDEVERLNEVLKNKILDLVEDGFYDDIK